MCELVVMTRLRPVSLPMHPSFRWTPGPSAAAPARNVLDVSQTAALFFSVSFLFFFFFSFPD